MSTRLERSLDWAHPLVRDWFSARFGTPTEAQEAGWPAILAGETTLIAAPTGSGKTLSAFLAAINALVIKAIDGTLKDETEVVYISPLKALSNDIQKNLALPLSELSRLAEERGLAMAEIRAVVRTGDTLQADRQKMLRKPPHILVTTPESFYLLLTAEKSRQLMRTVKTVIVDEIHAIADDKRGSHLALSLERLELACLNKPTRVGLSATQKPIDVVAQFLAGSNRPLPKIIDVGHKRQLDLAVMVPDSPLGAVASNDIWDETLANIAALVKEHRSTLIFVNTRRQAERIALLLAEKIGPGAVASHHGSLSRKIRLDAENRLKNGEIKVLVATASLELGIDIGFIDLVCQISSPRSIATALQRIGRAGHWRGAIPKGRIFAMTRDELVEAAALVKAIQNGELDRLHIPVAPLDVLCQQIVAMCSVEEWTEDDLFQVVRRAYPYKDLSREDFDSLLELLSDGIASSRGRYGAYLMRDRVNERLKARRGARLAALTSGGAIPESNLFQVVAEPEGLQIGTVDEDFAIESYRGDIFLLGNTSWRIRRVEGAKGRVLVENAHGASPSVPFWFGEAPARTFELSHEVSALRQLVNDAAQGLASDFLARHSDGKNRALINRLKEECALDQSGAEQLIDHIMLGKSVLNAVPTKTLVVAERFFDEGGGMQLVIHAPFGSRINKAWGLCLRKKFCRSFNFELQASANDNGLNISLAEQHSFPLADVFFYLSPNEIRHTLEQASLQAPVFGTRFRWNATRSLQLLRFNGGRKVPPNLQRMRADDLLAAVFPQAAACQDNIVGEIEIPDHPLLKEVMKDVLTEAMDLEGLEEVISGIASGSIQCLAIDTPIPSAFSHEILNANPYAFLDDAPLEERRARAVEMRRMLPDALVSEVGGLDAAAVEKVREESLPDIRDADDLHDFMQTAVVLPQNLLTFLSVDPDLLNRCLSELKEKKRVAQALVGRETFWITAEKKYLFDIAYPTALLKDELPKLDKLKVAQTTEEKARVMILQGWLSYLGPSDANKLAQNLCLNLGDVNLALLTLESAGAILRGHFEPDEDTHKSADLTDPTNWQWCDRRLLARIHRLTLNTLRKQIETLPSLTFMRWLTHWQHAAPGTQLTGEAGVLTIISQLQGLEIAANVWEREVFKKRLSDYDPSQLDHLCLTGSIGWGRLSAHPAFAAQQSKIDLVKSKRGSLARSRLSRTIGNGAAKFKTTTRVIPTSVAPIAFFVRAESDWLSGYDQKTDDCDRALSHSANSIQTFLKERGASFFVEITRGTGLLKSEVEEGLWELVTAGLVTADGFDNLRALIDPARRAGRGKQKRPRDVPGRWSLLHATTNADRTRTIEATCRVLLARYGLVFRELLQRETFAITWRELLQVFRSMEERGEVRGGRFVDGFLGEQFALPEALESLRAFRNRPPNDQSVALSAADPLNLTGLILPGERIPSISSKSISVLY